MSIMEDYPGRIVGIIGYTEEMSHLIQAGSDIFLMPSRYEPCGLTQMYSLRYGTLPLANAVGGLRDTIIPYPAEDATGFIRSINTPEDLLDEVDMALEVWGQKRLWKQMQKRAMKADFSWAKSSIRYIDMYNELGNSFSPVVTGRSADEGGSDEDAGDPG
jgi:starch synthase